MQTLKNAEMFSTTLPIAWEYLHKASAEDQDTLKATMKQLKGHDELLAEVLKH
jgi:hypothetical protein